jgi:hypothetical protein
MRFEIRRTTMDARRAAFPNPARPTDDARSLRPMTPSEPTDPTETSRDPAGVSSPGPASLQAYLDEVQARLADPAVLARASALARERGLDLETMTFGDLDDLVNDATRSIAADGTG